MSAVERLEVAPGLSISRVLTGLWQIADMERHGPLDLDATADAMRPYAEVGLTTFDMADHYGSAEEIAGRYVARHGADGVEMLTKWVPEPGARSREDVRAAVTRALGRMRTERIDLLQTHTWNYADPSYFDTLGYLEELREEGLIQHLGVTNVDTAHLRMMVKSGVRVVSNQVSFSLLDRRARDHGMLRLCRDEGIALLAFGTLAGGLLTERWLGVDEPEIDELATWSQRKYARYVRAAGGWNALQRVLAALRDIADKHEVSMATVACRTVLDEPGVAGVIIGARLGQSEHIQDSIRLAELALDEDDRRQLDEATAELQPIPGDCGDEYRRPPYLTAAGDLSDHLDTLPPPYPTTEASGRARVDSGTIWEDLAGFSRALRDGNRILVSGTTATHGDRLIGGEDAEAQTDFIIDKIEGALQSAGATLEDVVRTRIYLHDSDDWEPVSRAHGRRFAHVRPANTLVGARLIGDGYRVEIEAEAIVRGEDTDHR